MAHFRGTVRGGQGQSSRPGHKSTGLTTTAAGWRARILVELWVHEDGRDMVSIEWRSLPKGPSRAIYRGPLDEMPEAGKPFGLD